jgi:hypothetical protein
MASVLRSYAQVPSQVRYFLTTDAYVAPGSPGVADVGDSTLVFIDGYPGSIIEEGSVVANYVSFGANELLKDLGRSVTITNAASAHIARYRQVQRVNGPTTEGVGPIVDTYDGSYGCFYVKVWSADGQGVLVVRTG